MILISMTTYFTKFTKIPKNVIKKNHQTSGYKIHIKRILITNGNIA